MTTPKRVWSNKKTVWDGKKSVWLQDGELKTYDGNWEDAGSDLQTYGSQWEEVSDDAILDVYDSNTPEPIGTAEDGVEATYTFKDYDGTVLKTGKVKDGETPVAPTDPTREGYTFDGWNPTVGPISKNTEYVAVYTATPTYTLQNSIEGEYFEGDGGDIPSSASFMLFGDKYSGDEDYVLITIDGIEERSTATVELGGVFNSEDFSVAQDDLGNVWDAIFFQVGAQCLQRDMIDTPISDDEAPRSTGHFVQSIFADFQTLYSHKGNASALYDDVETIATALGTTLPIVEFGEAE